MFFIRVGWPRQDTDLLLICLNLEQSHQPRTQALSTTRLAAWRKDPGPGWSRVSQILGDNNWDLWVVGNANVAFEFKTIQGV